MSELHLALLKYSTQGIFGVDLNGRVVFANSCAEKVIGCPEDEIIGIHMHLVGRREEQDLAIDSPCKTSIFKTLSDGETRFVERDVIYQIDGKPIEVDYLVAALSNKGEITGAVLMFDNVSCFRRQAKYLRQQRARLRLLAAHQEKIRERERLHIAREIHDELGQQLTAIRIDAAMLEISLKPDMNDFKAQLHRIKKSIDDAISSVRKVATSLRPAVLDMGLRPAIDWLLDGFFERTGVRAEISVTGTALMLKDECATAVFRCLQESITNINRHANASIVKVLIQWKPHQLMLKIMDNGQGFDSCVVRRKPGLGLMGIRERVLSFGGEVKFNSVLGQGTEVILMVPITRFTCADQYREKC